MFLVAISEKKVKLGLLELVGKLCLFLKVSDPSMKRSSDSNSGQVETSS